MPTKRRLLIPYLGSKFRLAPRIIQEFKPHDIYVEPYGGAAAVLLAKPPCRTEIYNELNDDLINLFKVLRTRPGKLIRALKRTPYAQVEFNQAYRQARCPVEQARRLIIRAHGGFHSKAVFGDQCVFRLYGSGMHNRAHYWQSFSRDLVRIVNRVRRVTISQMPAVKLITDMDSPDTLHYVDPPYVSDTRKSRTRYLHEMDNDDHMELLDALQAARGQVILSGYASELYDSNLASWRRIVIPSRVFNTSKRQYNSEEVLWIKKPS